MKARRKKHLFHYLSFKVRILVGKSEFTGVNCDTFHVTPVTVALKCEWRTQVTFVLSVTGEKNSRINEQTGQSAHTGKCGVILLLFSPSHFAKNS